MKVLFDVFELSPAGGKSMGIYHYAKEVWRACVNDLPEDMHVVLVCHGENEHDFFGEHPQVTKVIRQRSTPSQWQRQQWLRWGAQALARALGCGVYFSPKGFLPGLVGAPSGLKTCVVVHDLIPLWYAERWPGYFSTLELAVLRYELTRTCRHADRLVTISQASADDILARVPGAKRPAVVHNGLPLAPQHLVQPTRPPFIFAMASAYPHKNARVLLDGYQCYRALSEHPLDLVVCGIDDPGLPGVQALKGISAEALHGHYRAASLFVFLSLVEGFGFPPLEAMQHGTPVLCSDLPVLRETVCGNAFFVRPDCSSDIGAAIHEALSDAASERRLQLRQVAPHVVGAYAWDRCAKGLLAQLRGLV